MKADFRTNKEVHQAKTRTWIIRILALVILFVIPLLFSGCAGLENYLEKGEDFLDQTQDVSREVVRTGRSVQQLKRQRTCFEVKNASKDYEAEVRITGSDKKAKLSSTEYTRYEMKASRFSDIQMINVDLNVFTSDGEYVGSASQQVENRFRRYQISDKGCGILYFVSEGERIAGLQQPRRSRLY